MVGVRSAASRKETDMYKGPIIDCDVHHNWKNRTAIVSRLPAEWRDFANGFGSGYGASLFPAAPTHPNRHGHNKRIDTFPPDGGVPGSDYETMRKQLLDPLKVERAILLFDTGTNVGHPNLYFANALASAINDWNLEEWLGRDQRLFGAVLTPTQDPTAAAREIRRVGRHPKIVTVLMNWNPGFPFGHPFYHPIYEAAAELNLPVSIHVGVSGRAPWTAGGLPASRVELHTLLAQAIQHHFASMITHGVFEKYPDLRVALIEVGLSWVPWLMWGLDAHYEILRRESPWVKRLPSEYLRKHAFISTQPMDLSPEPGQLIDALEAFGQMEDLLCFASDYPHWDADDPLYVARRLPTHWTEKVFWANSARLYRWPVAAPALVS
jgi:predicted TIM-barrel fold metal-dependent hydrolase